MTSNNVRIPTKLTTYRLPTVPKPPKPFTIKLPPVPKTRLITVKPSREGGTINLHLPNNVNAHAGYHGRIYSIGVGIPLFRKKQRHSRDKNQMASSGQGYSSSFSSPRRYDAYNRNNVWRYE